MPTVGDIKNVTFQGNGGCIVSGAGNNTCLGASKQKTYNKGDSLYSSGIEGSSIYSAYKENALFIGWSLGSNDRNLLPNNYKVNDDMAVYAQYLETDIYRLEFHIDGNERFNVDGVTGEAATKPYYIERVSTISPTISTMGNASDFFVKNAVRKDGYRFDYWEDEEGNKVTPQTVMNKQYMILYPHFTEMSDKDQEMLSLHMILDLNNVTAGKTDNVKRLFALYPFTKMEYSLQYTAGSDSFDIIQKEIMNKDYGTLTGVDKGTVMSTKTFHMNTDSNFYLDVNGKKYQTFSSYVKASLNDPEHTFSISDVRLQVKMPMFDLSNYYTTQGARDGLRSDSGITLTDQTAAKLFQNPAGNSVFTFKNNQDGQPVPMDNASLEAFNNKIADMTYNQGSFTNVGNVAYMSSGNVSYSSYRTPDKQGPPTEKKYVDEHVRKFDLHVILPISGLRDSPRGNFMTTDVPKPIKEIWITNVQLYVQENYIFISYELHRDSANGEPLIDSHNGRVDYNTLIQYEEPQYENDPNGNPLITYNKPRLITFAPDAKDYFSTDSNDPASSLYKLRFNQSYADTSSVNGMIHYNQSPSANKNEHWFPVSAGTGGYKGRYEQFYDNRLSYVDEPVELFAANEDNDILPSKIYPKAFNSRWNQDLNTCGLPFAQTIAGGSVVTNRWFGPKKLESQCVINTKELFKKDKLTYDLNDSYNETYKYTVTVPGAVIPGVNVISFATDKNQNYLPPFITNVPYK